MSIRKVVAGLLITAGIAIMAVPFFWRATGEKQTEQLISEFEQTLEDDYDEETDVEEEQTSISKEDEAILKEGGVIGIIEIPSIDIRYPVIEGTGVDVLNAGIGHMPETAGIGESGSQSTRMSAIRSQRISGKNFIMRLSLNMRKQRIRATKRRGRMPRNIMAIPIKRRIKRQRPFDN